MLGRLYMVLELVCDGTCEVSRENVASRTFLQFLSLLIGLLEIFKCLH